MIIPDANVLLHAHHAGAPQHERARRWVEAAFIGSDPVRLPWQTISAFMRIATHAKVFAHPFTMPEVIEIVRGWLGAPAVAVIEPGDRYWDIFSRLLVDSQVSGALAVDAALAALAMEFGATLVTSDRDFRRFDGLKIFDPLSEG
jgi:toxin-antitoxin system PIN domain toxin